MLIYFIVNCVLLSIYISVISYNYAKGNWDEFFDDCECDYIVVVGGILTLIPFLNILFFVGIFCVTVKYYLEKQRKLNKEKKMKVKEIENYY